MMVMIATPQAVPPKAYRLIAHLLLVKLFVVVVEGLCRGRDIKIFIIFAEALGLILTKVAMTAVYRGLEKCYPSHRESRSAESSGGAKTAVYLGVSQDDKNEVYTGLSFVG